MTNKYHTLQPFLEEILGEIRKDIKNDYLPGSVAFTRAHFGNRPLNRIPFEEVVSVLSKELLNGNQDLSEWVVNHWVFKHGDLYQFFAERLSQINSDFDTMQTLSIEQSRLLLVEARALFNAKLIYFFSVLNDVVFPETILTELRQSIEIQETPTEEKELPDLSQIVEKHQKEVARLTEKYEQKLSGVLKKYTTDINALKAQIRALQKSGK